MKNQFKEELWTPVLPENQKSPNAYNRRHIKILLEISKTVEEADEVISKNYDFKSVREKVAFLKGMFDISIVGHEEKEPDEMDYFSMLATIINHC